MTRKYPEIINPAHAVYNAMPEDEKAEHLAGHAPLVEAYTDAFATRAGYPIQIIEEGAWGESFRYTARLQCNTISFAIDRKLIVRDQMEALDHGLTALLRTHEHWQLANELHKIFQLHGTTETRN